jgi:uncharacterized repeat protein (TIGR02543 family)
VGGGTVSSTADDAIYATGASADIEVSGGIVSATNGNAIHTTQQSANVTVSGGFVFAYGTGIGGVVNKSGFAPGGTGVVVAWNETGSPYVYAKGDDRHLISLPNQTGTVRWDNDTAGGGIRYENGANQGFFPLPVRVTTDHGLIFNAENGTMWLDIDGNLKLDASDTPYTDGKGETWDGAPSTLKLYDFRWSTAAPAALTIIGDTTIIPTGTSAVHADYMGGGGSDWKYYGIYSESSNIIINGDGEVGAWSMTPAAPEPAIDSLYGIRTGGSITIQKGTLLGAAPSKYPPMKTYGVACNSFTMVSGTLEAFAFDDNALSVSSSALQLPAAYTYWTSSTDSRGLQMLADPGPGTCYTGTAPYAGPYVCDSEDQYVRITADPFAVVDNSNIAGTVGTLLTSPPNATITLYGDTKVANALANEDAGPWFANLPTGVSVKASASAGMDTITLTFEGTPTAVFEATFNIKIPANVLTGGSALAVKFNADAKFNIAGNNPASVCTITYGANDGEGELIPEAKMEIGSSYTIRPNAFVRDGYTPNGWNTKADGTGTPYVDGETITVQADLTLYAQWTSLSAGPSDCTITYDANGGEGTMLSELVPQGGNHSVPTSAFTRTGYRFTGWNTEADGDGTFYRIGETINNVRRSVTLYAQWTPTYTYNTPAAIEANGVTATVTFDKVRPWTAGEQVTATVTLSGKAIAAGVFRADLVSNTAGLVSNAKNLTVAANTLPADSYTFTFTVPSENVSDLILSFTFQKATVYTLTVTGGTGSGSYTAGEVVNVSADTAPAGQVFDRWVIVGGGGTLTNPNSMATAYTMPANDATIGAKYMADGAAGNPQTGDNSNIPLWAILGGTALIMLTFFGLTLRRRWLGGKAS